MFFCIRLYFFFFHLVCVCVCCVLVVWVLVLNFLNYSIMMAVPNCSPKNMSTSVRKKKSVRQLHVMLQNNGIDYIISTVLNNIVIVVVVVFLFSSSLLSLASSYNFEISTKTCIQNGIFLMLLIEASERRRKNM